VETILANGKYFKDLNVDTQLVQPVNISSPVVSCWNLLSCLLLQYNFPWKLLRQRWMWEGF